MKAFLCDRGVVERSFLAPRCRTTTKKMNRLVCGCPKVSLACWQTQNGVYNQDRLPGSYLGLRTAPRAVVGLLCVLASQKSLGCSAPLPVEFAKLFRSDFILLNRSRSPGWLRVGPSTSGVRGVQARLGLVSLRRTAGCPARVRSSVWRLAHCSGDYRHRLASTALRDGLISGHARFVFET